MTRLILIRHGQSEANEQNRFAGQTNVPLTELGKIQAKSAAEYITKREKIDKIYSSDLQRAHDTALPVSELTGLPINDVKGLREICAGVWEGMTVADIAEQYETEFNVWRNDFSNAHLPEGESVQNVYERVVPFVKQIARENNGLTLVLTSHATPIRAVLCNAQGWGWQRMCDVPFVNNSAISIFEYDEKTDTLHVIEHGIKEHLDPAIMSYIPKGLRN